MRFFSMASGVLCLRKGEVEWGVVARGESVGRVEKDSRGVKMLGLLWEFIGDRRAVWRASRSREVRALGVVDEVVDVRAFRYRSEDVLWLIGRYVG